MDYKKIKLFIIMIISCLGYIFIIQMFSFDLTSLPYYNSVHQGKILLERNHFINMTNSSPSKLIESSINTALEKNSNGLSENESKSTETEGRELQEKSHKTAKTQISTQEKKMNESMSNNNRLYPKYLDDVKVEDIYSSGFLNPQPKVCPFLGRGIKVLILVPTAPNHFEQRNAIRETWGNPKYFDNFYSFAFFVGVTKNTTVNDKLATEMENHCDIIQGTFDEGFYELTLKTVAMLEWASVYCPLARYLLKVDDDMFVNLANLQNVMERILKKRDAIFGSLARKWKPVRDLKSKYYVSKNMYSNDILPDFVTGPSYLLPISVAENMYYESLKSKYLLLEDVFLTGLIANKLNIKRYSLNEFRNSRSPPKKVCMWKKFATIHTVAPKKLQQAWKQLEFRCKYKPYKSLGNDSPNCTSKS